jgi:hypothetical protein
VQISNFNIKKIVMVKKTTIATVAGLGVAAVIRLMGFADFQEVACRSPRMCATDPVQQMMLTERGSGRIDKKEPVVKV